MKRREVSVTVVDNIEAYICLDGITTADLLAYISEYNKNEAYIDVSYDQHYYGSSDRQIFSIKEKRLETDEEFAARKEQERNRMQLHNDLVDNASEKERKLYEELKKKYEK